MIEYFYRFRSIEALLGKRKELKKQEIYFAAPFELNDPMEGYRDVFWHGDSIVWENLFRHYLRTLIWACYLREVLGEVQPVEWENVPILDPRFPGGLPIGQLATQIENDFFCADVDNYIAAIAGKTTPVRQDELSTHLLTIHPLALTTIRLHFERVGLSAPGKSHLSLVGIRQKQLETAHSFVKAAEQVHAHHPDEPDTLATLFAVAKHDTSQRTLANLYSKRFDPKQVNHLWITVLFPEQYIEQLNRLLYPDWYTACFMSNCDNVSMWSHYGDQHQGVCLKFKADLKSGRPTLTLQSLNSVSSQGSQSSSHMLDFEQVVYVEKLSKIDFFRSLGRLPTEVLEATWYFNEQGDPSTCRADVFGDNENWRKAYWQVFSHGVTSKLKDWSPENEHRLVFSRYDPNLTDKSNRKLRYNFESLDGIIFGIKTPLNKKLCICQLIEAKCKEMGRTDFKFYQAYYCPQSGKIKHTEMNQLQFKTN